MENDDEWPTWADIEEMEIEDPIEREMEIWDDEGPTWADIEEMEVEAAIERAEWACVICGYDLRDCGHDQMNEGGNW
jgi:hypothetical protein